jgi:hypothetical protein
MLIALPTGPAANASSESRGPLPSSAGEKLASAVAPAVTTTGAGLPFPPRKLPWKFLSTVSAEVSVPKKYGKTAPVKG